MSKSVRDQLLDQGLVKTENTPEARRAALRTPAVPVEDKALPPPFEAPARGVIVASRDRPATASVCEECGVRLPRSRVADEHPRCAECRAGSR